MLLFLLPWKMDSNSLVKEVGVFIYQTIKEFLPEQENLEIEARFGLLIDKETNERIYLPVITDSILDPKQSKWYRFESSLSAKKHKEYNAFFNRIYVETRKKGYKGASLEYTHKKQNDFIYSSKAGQIRITKDNEGNIIKIERKRLLGKLDIWLPNAELDIRLSLNIEEPVDKQELENEAETERKKDRISYQNQKDSFCVDLTQVFQRTDTGNEIKHEMELEWKDKDLIENIKQLDTVPSSIFIQKTEEFVKTTFKIARKKNVFISPLKLNTLP